MTYLPPNMSIVGAAELKHFYRWRHKMDWLLAPIHTRADLEQYLKATATSGSPLDALSPDARKRFLATLVFNKYGAFAPNYSDLQYLSTKQVYKILSLFGEQSLTLVFTSGRIGRGSPRALPENGRASLIEKRFAQYAAFRPKPGATQAKRARLIAQHYNRRFAEFQTPKFIRKVGNHDLRLLFRAATRAADASFEAKYARDARLDFKEMDKRHFAGAPDYGKMYEALVRTRQFGAARKFYLAHPDADLVPFPAYQDEAGNVGKNTPTIVVVSTTKNELIRRPVNLHKPAQVLILSDPHCEFCEEFDLALTHEPGLRAAFEQHALWITPPGSELEFDTLQQWNKTHPRAPLNIMYSLKGWPMIKVLALPQFVFLRNGKVVKREMGWGKGSLSEIETDMKAIGLGK